MEMEHRCPGCRTLLVAISWLVFWCPVCRRDIPTEDAIRKPRVNALSDQTTKGQV